MIAYAMDLTRTQVLAVESDASRIVVMAAAGSGKTRVLVERAIHLIQERGVSAEDVLIVTFTRKAAREIRQRIADRAGVRGLWCDTFHAIGLRMLSESGKALSVITPEESKGLFQQVCADLGLSKKHTVEAIKSRESYTQTGCLTAGRLAKMASEEFDSQLDRMRAVDYGGVLIRVLGVVTGRSGFRHILVDEAQDCDLLQWMFVLRLAARIVNESIFVVGDPNQSIFEWRGADPRIMSELPDTLSERWEAFRMGESFRCGAQISSASANLIEHNENGKASSIQCAHGTCSVETLMAPIDIRFGFWHRFAIQSGSAFLCRTNREADEIEGLLDSPALDVHRAGRAGRVSSESGFRCAWATLSLAWNPANDVAFNVLEKARKIDVTPRVLASIRADAARSGRSLWQSYVAVVDCKDALRYMIESKLKAASCRDVGYLVDMLSPEARDLLIGIAYMDDATDKLLRAMELVDDADIEAPDDSVYVGTIHGAKGLEFDNVCVVNCELGRFPRDSEKNVEAERRLMYVAMTRAKYSLVLHYQRDPSSFIQEALPDAVFA